MADSRRKVVEALGQRPHAELYAARMRLPWGSLGQRLLAPAEHRAFAREFAREQPFRAAISMPFAIPVYAGVKALGLAGPDASPPDLLQVREAYRGLGEGLVRPRKK